MDTTIGIDLTTVAVLVGVEMAVVLAMLLPTTITDSSSMDAAEDSATINQTGMLLLFIVQYIFDYLALREGGRLTFNLVCNKRARKIFPGPQKIR